MRHTVVIPVDARVQHAGARSPGDLVTQRIWLAASIVCLVALIIHVATSLSISLAYAAQSDSQPAVGLNPQDVVRLQLEAMADNDHNGPDSGIVIAFRFASPENKKQTGPIERFAKIVRAPAYASMLNNTGLEFGQTVIDNETALVPVIVTDNAGEPFAYLFRLSRQSLPDCDGCWMTDSVAPLPKPDEPNGKGQLL